MIKIVFMSLVLILGSCNKMENLPKNIEKSLILKQTALINGTNRKYHAYIPKERLDKPLLLLLHGKGW